MKVCILLAGKGRRMNSDGHKSCTEIGERSLLNWLIWALNEAGVSNIVPILGFEAEVLRKKFEQNIHSDARLSFVLSEKYETTNNLFSIYQARDFLDGEDFGIVNGDLLLDPAILKMLLDHKGENVIYADVLRKRQEVDSPKLKFEDGRIVELGRHLSLSENSGYAMGVYSLSGSASKDFFARAEKILFEEDDLNAGFHDPLNEVFKQHSFQIGDIGKAIWKDLDEAADLPELKRIAAVLESGGNHDS